MYVDNGVPKGNHAIGAIGDGRFSEYNFYQLGLNSDGNKYSGIQAAKWKWLRDMEKKTENYEEVGEPEEQCVNSIQNMKFGNNGSLNLIAGQNRGYNSSQKKCYDRPYIFFVKVSDGRREKFLFPMKYAKKFYNILGEIISMQSEQVNFIEDEIEF